MTGARRCGKCWPVLKLAPEIGLSLSKRQNRGDVHCIIRPLEPCFAPEGTATHAQKTLFVPQASASCHCAELLRYGPVECHRVERERLSCGSRGFWDPRPNRYVNFDRDVVVSHFNEMGGGPAGESTVPLGLAGALLMGRQRAWSQYVRGLRKLQADVPLFLGPVLSDADGLDHPGM